MKIKDLVSCFSTDTVYEIRKKDNPHLVYWYGKGNTANVWDNDEDIAGILHTSKKLIIYV